MAKTVRTAPTRGPERRPRFPALVQAYQEHIEARLKAEDPAERHRALQQKVSLYDVAHLTRFFGGRLVSAIDSSAVVGYAMKREGTQAAIPIINEELRTLARLLRFAVQQEWLRELPEISLVPDPASPMYQRLSAASYPAPRGPAVSVSASAHSRSSAKRDRRALADVSEAEFSEFMGRFKKKHSRAELARMLREEFSLTSHCKTIENHLKARGL